MSSQLNDLSEKEKEVVAAYISKHYFLIKRTNFYSWLGGVTASLFFIATAFLTAAYQGGRAYVKDESFQQAKRAIKEVRNDSSSTLKRIEEAYAEAEEVLSDMKKLMNDMENEEVSFIKADSIEASMIALTDIAGKQRIVLSTAQEGEVSYLRFKDTDGRDRLSLFLDEGGKDVGIKLFDEDRNMRASLAVDSVPSFDLYNAAEKRRITMYENSSGYSGINVLDTAGRERIKLLTHPDGGYPRLGLFNADESQRVSLYENETGFAGLRLDDTDEVIRGLLVTEPKGDNRDGQLILELRNADGDRRFSLGGSQLNFYDDDGKSLGKFPSRESSD